MTEIKEIYVHRANGSPIYFDYVNSSLEISIFKEMILKKANLDRKDIKSCRLVLDGTQELHSGTLGSNYITSGEKGLFFIPDLDGGMKRSKLNHEDTMSNVLENCEGYVRFSN